jgi:hypothetical protein
MDTFQKGVDDIKHHLKKSSIKKYRKFCKILYMESSLPGTIPLFSIRNDLYIMVFYRTIENDFDETISSFQYSFKSNSLFTPIAFLNDIKAFLIMREFNIIVYLEVDRKLNT